MKITRVVSERSTCLRRKVGAIVVTGKRILSTGYNGAPKGLAHCDEVGCRREKLGVPSGQNHEICRGLHAEMNALLQAVEYGIPIAGAVLYTTTHPCSLCAKMIINAGIRKVVISDDYPDTYGKKLLEEAKIDIVYFPEK
jgi:dCMP deaminase